PRLPERPGGPVALLDPALRHAAPTWPPRCSERPGNPWRSSIPRVLIDRCGGPRYGPPHPPSLGRAPAQPWRASGLTQDVSSAAVARRRDLQERHRAGAAERVLGQAAVPARQVLLLNEDRRQRGGHARVVRRLRVALEP